MTLSDLLDDVFGALPEDRRKMVQAMVDEYGAGENLRLLLALVASADRRERDSPGCSSATSTARNWPGRTSRIPGRFKATSGT
jgi:hypothetical protein